MSTPYCGHCGGPTAESDHTDCEVEFYLEPPRFCPQCAQRMRVQVTPLGWSAACAEHGPVTG